MSDSSDLDKLFDALSVLSSVGSFDDALEVLGIGGLPLAQKNGIIFGCLTFALTISIVMILLIWGGSFKRIAEQAETGAPVVSDAVGERVGRPLLLERLLDAQERMVQKYRQRDQPTEELTLLTKMLINIAPDVAKAKEYMKCLIDENDETKISEKRDHLKTFIPDGYEQDYIKAYRKCQDKPGGHILSGEPEARFEAYARSYAGCGSFASTSYRRSYARIYESVACYNHKHELKYRTHWLERPQDIVGRTVRLEPLESTRHLRDLFAMTCGMTYKENKAFDPNQVWAFHTEGPFLSAKAMNNSFVFQRKYNEAGFAIIESLTDRMIGALYLTNDDPNNLTISLDLPITKPSSNGTVEEIEGCFLLIDRLFALGYRRVQLSVDSMDTEGKRLSGRLGFTQEGLIPKDRIVKESNRDSIIYGLLNSDWDKGARMFLFKKLHGEKAMKVDASNEKNEKELEMQEIALLQMKDKENIEDTTTSK